MPDARATAQVAEAKIKQAFDLAFIRIQALNVSLEQLMAEIKDAQPVASGSVCLELYPCGPGCLGCPHPRWVRYRWADDSTQHRGRLICTNLDANKKEPVLALARRTPHYSKTVELIREAKSLIKERAALLAAIRTLKYAAKLTGAPDQD